MFAFFFLTLDSIVFIYTRKLTSSHSCLAETDCNLFFLEVNDLTEIFILIFKTTFYLFILKWIA